MFADHTSHDLTSTTPCYFTIPITRSTNNHFSVETPCCSPTFDAEQPSASDPVNPFLAYRVPALHMSSKMDSLMQAQTNAAHGNSPLRPRPRPLQQNVLHVSSDDASSSSSDSSDSYEHPESARCSRCQRTPSLDGRTGKSNMVPYGLNLWYCSRCANIVGLLVNR
nr:hypothetical protein CFP56_09039 [Quercus suber]